MILQSEAAVAAAVLAAVGELPTSRAARVLHDVADYLTGVGPVPPQPTRGDVHCGTTYAYRRGCRCLACRAANARAQAGRRARRATAATSGQVAA